MLVGASGGETTRVLSEEGEIKTKMAMAKALQFPIHDSSVKSQRAAAAAGEKSDFRVRERS